MTDLVPLPESAALVTPNAAVELERQVAAQVAAIADVVTAEEWRRRAEALTTYLEGTDAHGPMMGAARRIEARIGQLLGPPKRGRPSKSGHDRDLRGEGKRDDDLRRDFRTLGTAVDEGLLVYEDDDGDDSPWHATRRALVLAALLRDLSGVKGSVTVEWFTPARYIDAARDVMDAIDLDPASCAEANETVKAATYYDADADGLALDWHGRVWLNPPYGKGTGLFVSKLVAEYEARRVSAAVLLINAYGFDSAWFQPLWDRLLCFTDHRITFTSPQRGTGGPANANLFVYFGRRERRFTQTFSEFGRIVRAVE